MAEGRNRAGRVGPARAGKATIHIRERDGRLNVTAYLTIGERRAELMLPAWLDAATENTNDAVRKALQRVALSFLEELG